jgi:hypothetical protein
MSTALLPSPVKPILGVIAAGRETLESVPALIEPLLGPADLSSEPVIFTFTEFYRKEMGDDLLRRFFSFGRLISPDSLTALKIAASALERETGDEVSGEIRRRLNLDPGYLNANQVVLATTKPARQRLYLKDGIFGDLQLYYERGGFHPYEWTYSDYRLEATVDFFNRVRSIYIEQARLEAGK